VECPLVEYPLVEYPLVEYPQPNSSGRRGVGVKACCQREGADVERRLGMDTWQVSARVMELLQVMSLLVKAQK
jgi:hypothetical protein